MGQRFRQSDSAADEHHYLSGGGAPPPPRTDADASPQSPRRGMAAGADLSLLAAGPHPRRELTPMPRLGFSCPRRGMAAGADLSLLAARPHPRRELMPMPRLGFSCPRLGVAAAAGEPTRGPKRHIPIYFVDGPKPANPPCRRRGLSQVGVRGGRKYEARTYRRRVRC